LARLRTTAPPILRVAVKPTRMRMAGGLFGAADAGLDHHGAAGGRRRPGGGEELRPMRQPLNAQT
jgi:hypothetical protein